jgi:hypothetical protein
MGTEPVETLHEAISALAAIDLDALSDLELDHLTIALHRERHRLDAAAATVTARWEARGIWLSDGSRTSAARLSRDAGVSQATAKRELCRARALGSMTVTSDAVADGRISMDHVDLLSAADTTERHEAFVRDEAMLVEQCATLRYPQMAKVVAYWKLRAGDDAIDGAPPDGGRLHASTTLDGTVRIDGVLDPLDGEQFRTELNRLEREQYLADERAGTTRTAAQRRADALVEMARRSASMPKGARRPKPLLTILIGADRFADLCETATGMVLSPNQVLPHLGSAELESILFDNDLTILGVSNRRTFTGRLRRAVAVRGVHCEHPSGCDIPAAECDVDHIVPRCEGGATSQFNARNECRPHNRDAKLHDHGAAARPARDITNRDIARARRRWRRKRERLHWEVWRLTRLEVPDDHEPGEPEDPGAPPGHADAA